MSNSLNPYQRQHVFSYSRLAHFVDGLQTDARVRCWRHRIRAISDSVEVHDELWHALYGESMVRENRRSELNGTHEAIGSVLRQTEIRDNLVWGSTNNQRYVSDS